MTVEKCPRTGNFCSYHNKPGVCGECGFTQEELRAIRSKESETKGGSDSNG